MQRKRIHYVLIMVLLGLGVLVGRPMCIPLMVNSNSG